MQLDLNQAVEIMTQQHIFLSKLLENESARELP